MQPESKSSTNTIMPGPAWFDSFLTPAPLSGMKNSVVKVSDYIVVNSLISLDGHQRSEYLAMPIG